MGPALHFWYSKLMPRIVNSIIKPTSNPNDGANRFKFAAVGMALDQLLFAPIFLTGFFVFANWVKEDLATSGIKNGWTLVQNKMKETLITNWKIWPAATMVNLMFVPIQYRVLFANFIGLFWNMYLSYVTSN